MESVKFVFCFYFPMFSLFNMNMSKETRNLIMKWAPVCSFFVIFFRIYYIYIYIIYISVCVYIYIYQSITRYKKRLQCCIVNKQILKILLLRRGKRILICKKFAFDYKCLTLTVQLDSFRMKHIYNEFWHSFLFIFSSIISFYLKVFSVVSIDVDIQ